MRGHRHQTKAAESNSPFALESQARFDFSMDIQYFKGKSTGNRSLLTAHHNTNTRYFTNHYLTANEDDATFQKQKDTHPFAFHFP